MAVRPSASQVLLIAPMQARHFQVRSDVANGMLNIRDGPGTRHQILGSMSAGALVDVYRCVPRDDGIAGAPWCEVVWQGIRGWASTADMIPIELATPAPQPTPQAPVQQPEAPPPPPAVSQAEIELPVEFTGRWAMVYTPLCMMFDGCSQDHPMKLLGIPWVVGLQGTHTEDDANAMSSFKVFPDPQDRTGYVLVEQKLTDKKLSDDPITTREIWKLPYRYGSHTYLEKVDVDRKPSPEKVREIRGKDPELDALIDKWQAFPSFKDMKAAPQVTVMCKLAEGSNVRVSEDVPVLCPEHGAG